MKTIFDARTGEITHQAFTPEELAEMQSAESDKIIPHSITPRQFRLALIQRGISLQQIEQVIDSLPEPDQTLSRVSWEYATSFDRTDALLNQMAPAIELTQQDLDEIFINGQTL